MVLQESGEMYLETVYVLSRKKSFIRERTSVSKWASRARALAAPCIF